MKVRPTAAYGVISTIYECNQGEGLPWHNHPGRSHGHFVIRGRTIVEIEGREPFEMTMGMPNFELPPDLKHQITALDPDTIFMNLIEIGAVPDPDPTQPQTGGVLLDDGTIVYP